MDCNKPCNTCLEWCPYKGGSENSEDRADREMREGKYKTFDSLSELLDELKE